MVCRKEQMEANKWKITGWSPSFSEIKQSEAATRQMGGCNVWISQTA